MSTVRIFDHAWIQVIQFNLDMADIDSYLDSSPPGSPIPDFRDSEEANLPQNSASHTPSSQLPGSERSHQLAATTVIVCPDMGHFAIALSRNLGLKAGAHEELIKFSRFPNTSEAMVWQAGQILSLKETMAVIQPPNAKFEIPEVLEVWNCFSGLPMLTIFLDPTLSAYKDHPNKKLHNALKNRAAESGLTQSIQGQKSAMKVIGKKISNRFIHHRNDAKEAIAMSFGEFDEKTGKFTGLSLGVIALTAEIITAVGGRSYEHDISVPLVGRIAFLWHTYALCPKNNSTGRVSGMYWDEVDKALDKIRKSKNNDKT
ncbi:uncharacterized protein EV420DRAFT_1483702 [Desarmillaria tabescens]|uniref:Uncharacterized protein n=1 Tax=Armillaria tabescens TaxID=1929756 RepID=A0AA39MW11_ARMTA|nr:uncharacterized protein EV420DRAFT_1483702 [Desarmillaria tabescens]KAK0447905.1 hypothetical protein EV420DRAFT_1483702 [Desarmillaria tabescens]